MFRLMGMLATLLAVVYVFSWLLFLTYTPTKPNLSNSLTACGVIRHNNGAKELCERIAKYPRRMELRDNGSQICVRGTGNCEYVVTIRRIFNSEGIVISDDFDAWLLRIAEE